MKEEISRENFIKHLNEWGYNFTVKKEKIIVSEIGKHGYKNPAGKWIARELYEIPSNVVFERNAGQAYFPGCIKIGENVEFHNQSVTLGIEEIPKGTIFKCCRPDTIWGYVDLYRVKEIHPSVIFENLGKITFSKLKKIPEGLIFKNDGDIFFGSDIDVIPSGSIFKNSGDLFINEFSHKLKPGTVFENGGDVYVSDGWYGAGILAPEIIFKNKGCVHLETIKSLPKNTVFENGGDVHLETIKSLPKNTVFENGGDVRIHNLKKMGEKSVIFKNKGDIILFGVTEIHNDIKFENEGKIFLEKMGDVPKNIHFKKIIWK